MIEGNKNIFGVSGSSGSGKTLIAVKLFNTLIKQKFEGQVILTSGVPELTKNFKRVFKNLPKNFIVATPGTIINKYKNLNKAIDLIIIDETHRLKKPGTGKASSLTTKHIPGGSDEFKSLIQIANKTIFIYDENQICMPSDIQGINQIENKYQNFQLMHQMRNDTNFEKQINALIECRQEKFTSRTSIHFHKDFKEFYQALQTDKKNKFKPVIVSTLDRPKKVNGLNYNQFIYGDIKLSWMQKTSNWMNDPKALALKTVGYFHYIQGLEVDSIGVIVGKNIVLINNKIEIDLKHNHNHFQIIKGENDINKKLSINRLRVLLTRATKKLHIYVEDENLRIKWNNILNT